MITSKHNQLPHDLGPAQLVAVASLKFPRGYKVYTTSTVKRAARFIEALDCACRFLLIENAISYAVRYGPSPTNASASPRFQRLLQTGFRGTNSMHIGSECREFLNSGSGTTAR